MTEKDKGLMSDRAPEPVGASPHAKRVGNLLFLSGVGPRQRGTTEIPQGIEAQCRSCFDNVRAVLEDAGSSWGNIVDVLVFLTDMKNDFTAFNRLYAEHFAGPGKPNPTRTTIEVGALPTPIAVELKVIATIAER
jgi:2-aminomuconate deaminase